MLICIGLMIMLGTIMGYMWIPKSPFIYLSFILIISYFISLYAHLKID